VLYVDIVHDNAEEQEYKDGTYQHDYDHHSHNADSTNIHINTMIENRLLCHISKYPYSHENDDDINDTDDNDTSIALHINITDAHNFWSLAMTRDDLLTYVKSLSLKVKAFSDFFTIMKTALIRAHKSYVKVQPQQSSSVSTLDTLELHMIYQVTENFEINGIVTVPRVDRDQHADALKSMIYHIFHNLYQYQHGDVSHNTSTNTTTSSSSSSSDIEKLQARLKSYEHELQERNDEIQRLKDLLSQSESSMNGGSQGVDSESTSLRRKQATPTIPKGMSLLNPHQKRRKAEKPR